MRASSFGTPAGKRDDLVQGRGRFTDDESEGAIAFFVRSPHAAALIEIMNLDDARGMPGVYGILTGRDLEGFNLRSLSQPMPIVSRDGSPQIIPFRPCLAVDRVVHIGEPIAVVVAKTLAAAMDAAERVELQFTPEEAVVDPERAMESGAPQIWPQAARNIALDWTGPQNSGEAARVFAAAAHVVTLRLFNQRLAVATLEPRAARAAYDPATDSYQLASGSQGAAFLHQQIVNVMGIDLHRLQVRSGDVGGAFGMKTPAYPEYVAILIAARVFGVPVRWASTRHEAFLSDMQARDTIMSAELALNREGKFTALRISGIANMGAYLGGTGGAMPATNLARCLPTVYDIPCLDIAMRCVFTNTAPVGPYRGAGRPEANYAIERLIDKAADITGIDRLELRRRNFIRPEQMPYSTPMGMVFDSGDFPGVLEKAVRAADCGGFPARQQLAMRNGKRRGLGVACFLEHAGGAARGGVRVGFEQQGSVLLEIDAQSGGQSHDEVFGHLVATRLGVPAASVMLGRGDSSRAVEGAPTIGSRSAMHVSTAIHHAAGQVLENARTFLAAYLEVTAERISYVDGTFTVADTNHRMSLFDVAEAMRSREGSTAALDVEYISQIPHSFPNGCHVAEVEIDLQTGQTELVAYTAVDDCGNMLDAAVVEAQVQGGIAQGLGQVMFEAMEYDESGQLITGSFMDYCMPRATDVLSIEARHHTVPCLTNPLGVKGVGEAGTTGAICAIANAVVNALPPESRHRFQMPATPEKIWRACVRTTGYI